MLNLNYLRKLINQDNEHGINQIAISPDLTLAGTYATGDVYGGMFQIGKAGAYRGGGRILAVELVDTSNTGGQLDLFVYQVKPAVIADNAAFAESAADAQTRIAVIPVPSASWIAIGSTKTISILGLNLPFVGEDLYIYPVVRGTPSPTGLLKFTAAIYNQ